MSLCVAVARTAPVQVNIRLPEDQVEQIDRWVEWSNARRQWPLVTRTDVIRRAIQVALDESSMFATFRSRICDHLAALPTQPPPELTLEAFVALSRMAGSRFSRADACRMYLVQISNTADTPWDRDSLNRLITLVDDYSREASVPVGQ